jgi:hypothetical protein
MLSQYGVDIERVDHHVQVPGVGHGGEDFSVYPERRLAPVVRLDAARQGERNVPCSLEQNHYLTLMPAGPAWANLVAGGIQIPSV